MRVQNELRSDEFLVIAVTPVADGVVGPATATVLVLGGVLAIGATWRWPHQHLVALSLLALLPGLVLAGRLWRWRSNKVIVTSHRVMERGGVMQRHHGSFELMDVRSSRYQQSFFERLARRGFVILEMETGTVVLDRVRRPDALLRVIDHQRQQLDRRSESQLDRADELSAALDAGLLSHDEYDQRWRHLFGPDGPRA